MFKNLAPGVRVNRYKQPPVDLTTLPRLDYCKKLYLQGFKYIGVTEKAVNWLKQAPKAKLEFLLEQKISEKKEDEVEIIKKALELKNTVKKKVVK